jgi:hypothetical protein
MRKSCDEKAGVTSEQIKAKWSPAERRKRREVAKIKLKRLLVLFKRAGLIS